VFSRQRRKRESEFSIEICTYRMDFSFQKMMKAAVVTTFKQPLEVKQVAIPKPGVNDVLVKLISCGVCHTDLHVANGG
jgi:hypothetical protein